MIDKLLPFRRRAERQRSSDEELVAACASGDNAALEELFQRHGDQVHRILARLGYVRREDLDDLVQTTFLEVQRSARRFRAHAAVGTWILGIAMNVVRHYVRSETRRRSAMLAVAQLSSGTFDRRPDEHAANRQALGRVQDGFEALPPELRIVFTLCELENMRSTEVARVLDIPEGTVWRRLHQARARLRAFIEPEPTR
jgi:RNA polymerase sigma factor (sigma-70 family)